MTELLASVIIWITGPVGLPAPPPYTCFTDQQCYIECLERGDTHCDDMMYTEDK